MSDNPPQFPSGDPSGQQPNTPSGGDQPSYPGQQPYPGAQQPYGQQPYGGQPWGAPLPKHPKATMALVLGILGLIVCGFLAPFAWVIGGRAVAEIDANPGVYDGRGEAQAGRILGIIGSVLLILGVLAVAAFAALLIIGVATSSTSTEYSDFSLISLF